MVPCYSDNRSNSRANTCTNSRLGSHQEGTDLLDKRPMRACPGVAVNHDNFCESHGPSAGDVSFQISALSTFDGRIEAYHGGNG